LQFGNQELKPCKSVKWLGALIDNKLTFTEMINSLELKARTTIKQFSQLGKSRWGLREKDRVYLMEAVLLPRVLYGAPVWATKQNLTKITNLANKINNITALYTLGTFNSTPIT
jgi:hypothetical protein